MGLVCFKGDFFKILFVLIFLLLGAAFITRFFYTYPDFFPKLLGDICNVIIDYFGPGSIEESSNIETLYVFLLSLFFECAFFAGFKCVPGWFRSQS